MRPLLLITAMHSKFNNSLPPKTGSQPLTPTKMDLEPGLNTTTGSLTNHPTTMLPQPHSKLKCQTTLLPTMPWHKEKDTSPELMSEDILFKSIQDQSLNEPYFIKFYFTKIRF